MNTNRKPLYGDKALKIFFGGNPSPVATAMWATAMRNNYEDELAKLRQAKIPDEVRETIEMLLKFSRYRQNGNGYIAGRIDRALAWIESQKENK